MGPRPTARLGSANPRLPCKLRAFNDVIVHTKERNRSGAADLRLVLCQAASMGSNHMSERRELYRSPNGDSWFLGREPTNGHAFIIHQPNAPSGGRLSHIEVGAFLREAAGPEQQALLRLIGTLVEVPPYADRS
jgi:hypothetical protein